MSAIDLQSGFQEEAATVRVNQEEVFRGQDVTTKLLTGIAQQIDLPQVVGPARIDIELEQRGITKSIDIENDGDFFLGISIENGQIRYVISEAPFGYA